MGLGLLFADMHSQGIGMAGLQFCSLGFFYCKNFYQSNLINTTIKYCENETKRPIYRKQQQVEHRDFVTEVQFI